MPASTESRDFGLRCGDVVSQVTKQEVMTDDQVIREACAQLHNAFPNVKWLMVEIKVE
jgi:hypothetical protein